MHDSGVDDPGVWDPGNAFDQRRSGHVRCPRYVKEEAFSKHTNPSSTPPVFEHLPASEERPQTGPGVEVFVTSLPSAPPLVGVLFFPAVVLAARLHWCAPLAHLASQTPHYIAPGAMQELRAVG